MMKIQQATLEAAGDVDMDARGQDGVHQGGYYGDGKQGGEHERVDARGQDGVHANTWTGGAANRVISGRHGSSLLGADQLLESSVPEPPRWFSTCDRAQSFGEPPPLRRPEKRRFL